MKTQEQAETYLAYRNRTPILIPFPPPLYARTPMWIKRAFCFEWPMCKCLRLSALSPRLCVLHVLCRLRRYLGRNKEGGGVVEAAVSHATLPCTDDPPAPSEVKSGDSGGSAKSGDDGGSGYDDAAQP